VNPKRIRGQKTHKHCTPCTPSKGLIVHGSFVSGGGDKLDQVRGRVHWALSPLTTQRQLNDPLICLLTGMEWRRELDLERSQKRGRGWRTKVGNKEIRHFHLDHAFRPGRRRSSSTVHLYSRTWFGEQTIRLRARARARARARLRPTSHSVANRPGVFFGSNACAPCPVDRLSRSIMCCWKYHRVRQRRISGRRISARA
jgi:hypothetical protein